eukprot:3018468-Ditylum_brightwellii.AAC.1
MMTTTRVTTVTKTKAAPPTEHAKMQNKAQNKFYSILNDSNGKFHGGNVSLVKLPGENFPVELPGDIEAPGSLKTQTSRPSTSNAKVPKCFK